MAIYASVQKPIAPPEEDRFTTLIYNIYNNDFFSGGGMIRLHSMLYKVGGGRLRAYTMVFALQKKFTSHILIISRSEYIDETE